MTDYIGLELSGTPGWQQPVSTIGAYAPYSTGPSSGLPIIEPDTFVNNLIDGGHKISHTGGNIPIAQASTQFMNGLMAPLTGPINFLRSGPLNFLVGAGAIAGTVYVLKRFSPVAAPVFGAIGLLAGGYQAIKSAEAFSRQGERNNQGLFYLGNAISSVLLAIPGLSTLRAVSTGAASFSAVSALPVLQQGANQVQDERAARQTRRTPNEQDGFSVSA